MEILIGIVTVLLALFIFWMFATHFVDVVVEPVYMAVFHKPVYVHFYPIPKRLSDSQRLLLVSSFPFYRRLSDRRKVFFEHRIRQVIAKTDFHGKDGLAVTDEMRILIAATYVMLTFGFRVYLFNAFNKVILYPDSYQSTLTGEIHNGEFNPSVKYNREIKLYTNLN